VRHAATYYNDSLIVARELKRIGADIVHFADNKAAYHTSLAAVLAGARRVSHFRVTYSHFSWRERLCLIPVQSSIFVSKEAKDTFPISLPESKTRVVYDSVEIPTIDIAESNASVRREFAIPSGAPIVGMVARVSPQKDYETLALAAVEVLRRFPETRFLIVGDNARVDVNREHYQGVASKLQELGISNNFIFTGERNDVPQLLAAMDISVLCTNREGFPLSILESMAMRKPVIATAVGGIPEIVLPDVTGYLHRHRDSKGLADAIIALIEDPALTKRIGNSAYEHVKADYSRQRFVDDISKAYADLMAR
jgi:glycosyltransferase involved in cell wall biosynthesis